MGWEVFLSVSFYILICRAAECDSCQCLTVFDGYFITGNIYLSCTTGPGEFVRSVNTVFQLSFAVDPLVSDSDLDSSAGVASFTESFVAVSTTVGVGFRLPPSPFPASPEDIFFRLFELTVMLLSYHFL